MLQRPTQDADIIRRSTRPARLEQDDRRIFGIATPALELGDQLTDHDDRGIAHVVVDITEPEIDRRLVGHRRDNDFVIVLVENRLHELEMDRRHLRSKDRVRRLAVGGEARTLDRFDLVISDLLPMIERRQQRSQSNARRSQVRYLVELDHRVDAFVAFENFFDLVGRQRVEPATERRQLDQDQLRIFGGDLRGVVEPRMIAPLIDHRQPRRLNGHMIDGVLGDDRQSIRLNELGDAVIDLGVDVVRSTDQKDRVLARPLDTFQYLFAVLLNVPTIMLELGMRGIDCPLYFQSIDRRKFFRKPLR